MTELTYKVGASQRRTFLELVASDGRRHLSTWTNHSLAWRLARLILFAPGFQLAMSVRLQRLLGDVPLIGKFLRKMLWYVTTIWFSCDIDPKANFGLGLYFPHPTAIVIGGEWDVGDDAWILQGVTLGLTLGKSGEALPPMRSRVGDSVQIGAGAKVLGSISIGDGCVIGANAVVLESLPPGSVAVGVPARIVRTNAP